MTTFLLIASLMSVYSDWTQECSIAHDNGKLKISKEQFYKGERLMSKSYEVQDTVGFYGISQRILGSTFEEGAPSSQDSLFIVTAHGTKDGIEVETPVWAQGARNLETTSQEGMDFYYNVNFFCGNVP